MVVGPLSVCDTLLWQDTEEQKNGEGFVEKSIADE